VAWSTGTPDPADVLEELIRLQGFSIRSLAKTLVDNEDKAEGQRGELQQWIRGKRRGGHDPKNESLDQLAEALKVPPYLLRLLYRQADLNRQVQSELEQALALLAAEGPLGDAS
jgi:transcriptional regulator with XRE-family HTH domain